MPARAECARWFYARVLGLRSPQARGWHRRHVAAGHDRRRVARGAPGRCNPSTRNRRAGAPISTTATSATSWWRCRTSPATQDAAAAPAASAPPVAVVVRDAPPAPARTGAAQLAGRTSRDDEVRSADPNLVYVNGIDFETGTYAFAPRSIDEIAKQVLGPSGRRRHSTSAWRQAAVVRTAVRDGHRQTGGGRVGHRLPRGHAARRPQGTGAADRASPQAGRRPSQGARLQEGRADARLVSASRHLARQRRSRNRSLLPAAGWSARSDPVRIPVSARVEYAVGRLAFDTADDYERYARSTVAYEAARSVPNATRDRLLGHPPSG